MNYRIVVKPEKAQKITIPKNGFEHQTKIGGKLVLVHWPICSPKIMIGQGTSHTGNTLFGSGLN